MSGALSISPTKAQASLGVFGDGIDFESISRHLGMEASHTHRKGDPGMTPRPYPQDLWLLDTPLPHTETLDAHLRWLRQTLAPHYGFLRALKETAQVRSYCGFSADDRGSFRVSGEGLSLFTELDIDMEIGLVFLGPSDSSAISEEHGPTDAEVNARERGSGTYRTKSEVILEVTGASLDLSGISRALGHEPSETRRSGDLDSSGRVFATDLWSLAAPLPREEKLDAQLRWVGNVLLRRSDFIRSLSGKADLLLRCNFGTESDTGGLEMSSEALKALVDLNIPMNFHAYLIS